MVIRNGSSSSGAVAYCARKWLATAIHPAWFVLVLIVSGCAPSYQVTEELQESLMPGVCRIGTIVYDRSIEPIGAEPLPREPIHMLRQHLEFALERSDLFTGVTLYEDSADYSVQGVIRGFSDQSGNLSFPGLSRSGSVQLKVHLELQDRAGKVLFCGGFQSPGNESIRDQ